jgi:hypothetical protein
MNAASLRSHTAKDLAQIARRAGVETWHSLRKEELVAAILAAGPRRAQTAPSVEKRTPAPSTPTKPRVSAAKRRTQEKIAAMHQRRRALLDISTPGGDANGAARDRLVVLVRDPYWLHAVWELSSQAIDRARQALGQHWHAANPTLRVLRLADDGATVGTRSVAIHGGVSNWYVDVEEPPCRYRAEIGYAIPQGSFFCLARSNEVQTPTPGAADAIDHNWADVARNADRIYALSGGYSHDGASMELQELLEERLQRRLGRPTETRFGLGAAGRDVESSLRFSLDAELVVYGNADPHAHVTVQGEPVAVQPDGAFAVKIPFPDRRQVIPVVASSPDGLLQRTIILGVERNTKALEERRRETGE